MPKLDFRVVGAKPLPFTAAPLLIFELRITHAAADRTTVASIHSIALRCQIRIEPARRRYNVQEQEGLLDLFGEPARWGQTLRSTLWTHTNVTVPPFTDHIVVDLPVPCTFDFNVAVAKYFYALEDGLVPLCLLFSGTVFYEAEDGALQVAQIPWEKEANYELPVRVWKEMMDHYYPNSVWLCLRKDVFDRLYQYKSRHGLPGWEQALESLLPAMESPAPNAGEKRGES